MATEAFAHLVSIYRILIVLFTALPFFVLYFKSKSFQIPLKKFNYVSLILFAIIFQILFLFIEFISREGDNQIIRAPSEFIIINLLILYIYFMFQSYIWGFIYGHEIFIKTETKRDRLITLLRKSNDRLGAKSYRVQAATGAEYYIPGAFYTRFDQFIQELDEKKGFKVYLTHSSRNLRFFAILQTILILPLFLLRGDKITALPIENSAEILIFTLNLSANPTNIDIIFWFTIGILIFILYALSVSAISENLLLKYEDTFKRVKIDQAISLPSLGLKKPNPNIDEIKDNLKTKKDSAILKLEAEKKRRVEDVMGVLNPNKDKDEIQQMDPEVLRLEALIFNVRTVLQATPSHRKIPLEELHKYFSKKVKTNFDELESIIFGLIQRKEVEGNYNIWDRVYSGGTPARRFVDKTLEFAEDMQGELSSIKVKSDGSVEFYFEKLEESEINDKSNTKLDEEKKSDKFDSF